MPKKLKQHILRLLGVTGIYLTILEGLERAHLLMSLVSGSDIYETLEPVATLLFAVFLAWLFWRVFTDIRSGDFLD